MNTAPKFRVLRPIAVRAGETVTHHRTIGAEVGISDATQAAELLEAGRVEKVSGQPDH